MEDHCFLWAEQSRHTRWVLEREFTRGKGNCPCLRLERGKDGAFERAENRAVPPCRFRKGERILTKGCCQKGKKKEDSEDRLVQRQQEPLGGMQKGFLTIN